MNVKIVNTLAGITECETWLFGGRRTESNTAHMSIQKARQGSINSLLAYDAFETIVLEAEQEEENVENEMYVQQMCKGEE